MKKMKSMATKRSVKGKVVKGRTLDQPQRRAGFMKKTTDRTQRRSDFMKKTMRRMMK